MSLLDLDCAWRYATAMRAAARRAAPRSSSRLAPRIALEQEENRQVGREQCKADVDQLRAQWAAKVCVDDVDDCLVLGAVRGVSRSDAAIACKSNICTSAEKKQHDISIASLPAPRNVVENTSLQALDSTGSSHPSGSDQWCGAIDFSHIVDVGFVLEQQTDHSTMALLSGSSEVSNQPKTASEPSRTSAAANSGVFP